MARCELIKNPRLNYSIVLNEILIRSFVGGD